MAEYWVGWKVCFLVVARAVKKAEHLDQTRVDRMEFVMVECLASEKAAC